jgi:hypothetical protein
MSSTVRFRLFSRHPDFRHLAKIPVLPHILQKLLDSKHAIIAPHGAISIDRRCKCHKQWTATP